MYESSLDKAGLLLAQPTPTGWPPSQLEKDAKMDICLNANLHSVSPMLKLATLCHK